VATGKRERRYKAWFQLPLWESLLATWILSLVKLRKPSRLGVDQIEMSFWVGVGQLKKERYPATAGVRPSTPKRLCAQLRQTVIMKRPYRDVLVWLADIRPPIHDLAAERAVAAVIAMLAAYDRDQRLAAVGGAVC
jgi:hypothetical protein